MPHRSLRPLGAIILALLRERDMHPYEMMRLLRDRGEDRLVVLRNGTFYHQVSILEREGLVEQVGVDREGNRPERTTYTLTPHGHEAVAAWVRDRLRRTDGEADFRVALAEAHNIGRDEVSALLDDRLAGLRAQREILEQITGVAAGRAVDRQYTVEVERALALVSADIAWTEGLRSDLDDDGFAWGRPSPAHLAGKERA